MDGEGGSGAGSALALGRRSAQVLETAKSPPISLLFFDLQHSGGVVSEDSLQLLLAGGRVDTGVEEGVDA